MTDQLNKDEDPWRANEREIRIDMRELLKMKPKKVIRIKAPVKPDKPKE